MLSGGETRLSHIGVAIQILIKISRTVTVLTLATKLKSIRSVAGGLYDDQDDEAQQGHYENYSYDFEFAVAPVEHPF